MTCDVYVPLDPKLGIDAASGVVGRPHGDHLIELYYEGNRFGYANVKTFADRCMIAAGRMAQSYPTVARAHVGHAQVRRVGVYDDEAGEVRLADLAAGDDVTLADWLGIEPDELPGELVRSGR